MRIQKNIIDALLEAIPGDAWRRRPESVETALMELMSYLDVTDEDDVILTKRVYSEIPTNVVFAGVSQPIKRWELNIRINNNEIRIFSEKEVLPACELNPVLMTWKITTDKEEFVDLVYDWNGWVPADRTPYTFSMVY